MTLQPAPFVFNTPPRLIVGADALAQLPAALERLGVSRPLIVSDHGLERLGIVATAVTLLQGAGLRAQTFLDVTADPPEATVNAALRLAEAHGADGVVGLGGGSPLDVAKIVALLVRSPQPFAGLYGVELARGPRLPLIAVPTTAGTGSEVTPIAILTKPDGQKAGVNAAVLVPDVALLDPTLTYGLPPAPTAATGLDAMVHATEAFTSARLKNPLSDALALEALRRLGPAVPRAVADGSDRAARFDALFGACLAGMAFANAPVGAVHALAYPVGARYKVAHGVSIALLLAPVLWFNHERAAGLYGQLGPALDHRLPTGDGAAFIDRIAGLVPALGLPHRLRDVGATREDLPGLAADAMLQTRLLGNNPRPVTESDARTLFEAAF